MSKTPFPGRLHRWGLRGWRQIDGLIRQLKVKSAVLASPCTHLLLPLAGRPVSHITSHQLRFILLTAGNLPLHALIYFSVSLVSLFPTSLHFTSSQPRVILTTVGNSIPVLITGKTEILCMSITFPKLGRK